MKKIFLTLLLFILVVQNVFADGILGYNTIGSTSYNFVELLWVQKYQVTTDSGGGIVQDFCFYTQSADRGDDIKIAIYDAVSGGNLIYSATVQGRADTAGWTCIDLSSLDIELDPLTSYYPAIACSGSTSDHGYTFNGSQATSGINFNDDANIYANSMSDPGATTADYTGTGSPVRVSFYITYEAPPDSISIDETTDYMADGRVIAYDSSEEGSIVLSGAYVGTPTAIEVRVFNRTTTNTVQVNGNDWNTVDASPTGGTWSGTLNNIPKTNAWLGFEARWVNNTGITDTSSNNIGVGHVVLCTGQSFIDFWFDWHPGTWTKNTANSLTRKYRHLTTGQSEENPTDAPAYTGWQEMTGDGAIIFSDLLQQELQCPIGMLDYGIGGSALLQENEFVSYGWWVGATGSTNWLEDLQEGLLESEPSSRIKANAVIWIHGWTDGNIGVTQSEYKTGLDTLFTAFRSDTNNATLPVYICGLAKTAYGTSDSNVAVRMAEIEKAEEDANSYMGATVIDLPLYSDGIHFEEAEQEIQATRMAQAVLAVEINSGNYTYYRSPRAVGYAAVNDTTTDITILHDGGTDFTPTSGIDSFQVYNGSGWISATGVRQDANTVRLTHASATVSGARCLQGSSPTTTNILKDNTTLALPLEPNDSIPIYDVTNPVCTITSPTTNTTYNAGWALSGNTLSNDGNTGTISLSGTASDNLSVSSVTWACPNCTPSTGTATGTTSWSISDITLADKSVGTNVFTVTATDQNSNTHDDVLTVIYDSVTGYTLPTGWGLGDVSRFKYEITARDSGSGKSFIGGCFPETQLINQVGIYYLDLEIDDISTGPQFISDSINGWAGSINVDSNVTRSERIQDN